MGKLLTFHFDDSAGEIFLTTSASAQDWADEANYFGELVVIDIMNVKIWTSGRFFCGKSGGYLTKQNLNLSDSGYSGLNI